jgi:hypothetical protein
MLPGWNSGFTWFWCDSSHVGIFLFWPIKFVMTIHCFVTCCWTQSQKETKDGQEDPVEMKLSSIGGKVALKSRTKSIYATLSSHRRIWSACVMWYLQWLFCKLSNLSKSFNISFIRLQMICYFINQTYSTWANMIKLFGHFANRKKWLSTGWNSNIFRIILQKLDKKC